MRLLSSVTLTLLLTLPAREGRGVRRGVRAATRGEDGTLGVLCASIPMSLGVNLSRGDSKCLAANLRAAGDMLARRSVFDLKLYKTFMSFTRVFVKEECVLCEFQVVTKFQLQWMLFIT